MTEKTTKINEKRGGFIALERTTVYQNKYGVIVFEDKVIRPDGKEGIYGWIQLGSGVSVLPIDDENNVYLGRGFMYPINRDSIEVASGGIEPGEPPSDAARRELEEELGIKARELIHVGSYRPITGRINTTQYMYIAKGLDFGENTDHIEDMKLMRMPLEEAVRRVMNSEIDEGLTMVMILKANELFGRKN